MFMNPQQEVINSLSQRSDRENSKKIAHAAFLTLALSFFIGEAGAVSAIFTGLSTFATAVISILGAAVIVGLVVLLIVSLSQGQVNWGPILFGLLAVVLIAGIAANVNGFLGALGINIQAAGMGYSDLAPLVQ